MIAEAESRGERVLCPMRSALAVTSGYFEGKEGALTRIHSRGGYLYSWMPNSVRPTPRSDTRRWRRSSRRTSTPLGSGARSSHMRSRAGRPLRRATRTGSQMLAPTALSKRSVMRRSASQRASALPIQSPLAATHHQLADGCLRPTAHPPDPRRCAPHAARRSDRWPIS